MASTAPTDDEAQGAETDLSSGESFGSDASASSVEDVKNLKKLMTETKVDGGKSAWATTLETFGMSDGGKKKKGDILCDNFEDAMKAFLELTKDKDWEFATTPFDDFQATKEDLLKAFVHWSRKGDDSETSYNPSKALRRLEAYVQWMDKNCKDMNLKGSSMKDVADAWQMKLTHDKEGRLVWWIDIGGLDLKFIKTQVSSDDTLRYCVWLSHLVLFDKGSQENGFVFVQAFGKKGMLETLTMISMDLGTKIDRLTIGILPIKMEACILYNNPTWLRLIMGLMAPFMGKKMRSRIKSLSNKKDPQAYFEEFLGKENIPTGVAKLQGAVEKDLIAHALERLAENAKD